MNIMAKKVLTILTLICFVLFEYGCTREYIVAKKDIPQQMDEDLYKVVMNDGAMYEFLGFNEGGVINPNWRGDSKIVGNVVTGKLKDGRMVTLSLNDISMIYVQRISVARTLFAIVGVPAVIGMIVWATKESCPFIYSYDGTKYVFDGEPYGGSTCEALARTDYCRLDYLKPVEGQYRLKLTNEVDETQHTDALRLWVIDTPVDVLPVPDAQGHIYTIAKSSSPTTATDRHGTDITRWLAANDELFWQNDLRTIDSNTTSALRDTLTFQFPKPNHTSKGKLVVSASNTLWASQMLKRDLELWGSEVNSWYEQLRQPAIRSMFDAWHQREEVFHLQVRVLRDPTGLCVVKFLAVAHLLLRSGSFRSI
jgi:hypothetical protein